MPRRVGAQHAQSGHRTWIVGLVQQAQGIAGGGVRPRGVGIESVRLVEKDALRPFEHHFSGLVA